MLELVGKFINKYESPKGKNKDGEEYGGQDRIQMLCEKHLQNGDVALEMVSLTVDNLKPYDDLQGKEIRVPVGVFSRGKGISFYIPHGGQPEAVGS